MMMRLAILVLVFCLPAAAGAQTVLAGHPLTAGLAQALTKGIPVAVEVVVPPAVPMSRQHSYLTGRGEARLAEAAGRADAVVTLRSAWNDDPLYPLARRTNIRVVEIDATHPLDHSLPGIGTRENAPFPWLGLSNLGRMTDILASDLKRLYPGHGATIEANVQAVKAGLLAVTAKVVREIALLSDTGVVLLSDRFAILAADLGLDVHATLLHDDRDWTPERLAELSSLLKGRAVPVVLHHREPAPAIAAAIREGGARLVVLDSFDTGPPADPVSAASGLVDRLVGGFSQAR